MCKLSLEVVEDVGASNFSLKERSQVGRRYKKWELQKIDSLKEARIHKFVPISMETNAVEHG